MLQLTEIERFHIRDRGDIIVVELSPEWLDHNDPRSLLDTTVEIDGVSVRVAGVETFCTPWYPNQGNTSPHRNVGLLVRDKRK